MKEKSTTSRRSFLRTSAALPAVAAGLTGSIVSAAEDEGGKAGQGALPTRKLGRKGPEVSVIAQGGSMAAHSPMLLELAWTNGVRYFDASVSYLNGKCEGNIAKFIDRNPARRKELFVASKDKPKSLAELTVRIDARLKALHTDYLDLFLIHGIGPGRYGEKSLQWPKSDEWKELAARLKSSGKVRMVGFSCHDARLVDYMNAAAEGGFLDALLIAYDPFHDKGGAFDRALDACHKAGIGLVAMKNMRALGDVSARIPELDRKGLTTRAALIQAVLSDKRISALCIESANVAQLEENTGAARNFKPGKGQAAVQDLRRHVLEVNHRMCPGCDACREIAADTDAALLEVARYVAYYEGEGRTEARDFYRELSNTQRRRSSELAEEARRRCRYHVDYPLILAKAERYFTAG